MEPGKPPVVTREQVMAKLADVERNVDHFTLFELDRSATGDAARAAYIRLVKLYHPDKLILSRLEAMRPQVARIMGRLSEAFTVLSDDAKRAAYLRVLAQGGEAAVRKRDDAATAQAHKILKAEEHFNLGGMALRRSSFAVALKEFSAAVGLNDGEADYHACLGWAKWCNATDKAATKSDVRTDFARALKLNASCVDGLFYRGLMDADLGETDRALAGFRKVLEIDAGHSGAAQQVRVLDMRKDRGGPGKRLLDLFKKKPKPDRPGSKR